MYPEPDDERELMHVTRAAFGPRDLMPDQRHLSVFEHMWHDARAKRGARYRLKLDIPLVGGSTITVICLDELKKGASYLLEAEPGVDGVYHYIRLVREDGVWQFDMVLGGLDYGGVSPYERGQAMRPCFV